MNLARRCLKAHSQTLTVILTVAAALGGGCGSQPKISSPDQIAAFQRAGPLPPMRASRRIVSATVPSGPYRLVPGDLLELHMPEVMAAVSADIPCRNNGDPCRARVCNAGTICLPAVGEVQVADVTLSEAEQRIRDAYCPKYMAQKPPVVARLAEYCTRKILITGAVKTPGLYDLRSDEMCLQAALMKAGGVVSEGACAAFVHHSRREDGVALPIRNSTAPHANPTLTGGETVEIEPRGPRTFSVSGLVKKPGAFPYPPGAEYNLVTVLGMAGGVDDVLEPQFVKIYRTDASGRLVPAVFKIGPDDLAESGRVLIKPGDAVSVEHSPRTRFRSAMSSLVRGGLYAGASYNVAP